MGNAARKPVFGVSNQLSSGFPIRSYQKQPAQPQRLSQNGEISIAASIDIILSNKQQQKH